MSLRNFDPDNSGGETLIEFNEEGFVLSPSPDNILHVNFAINEPMWHQICLVWDYSMIFSLLHLQKPLFFFDFTPLDQTGKWNLYIDGSSYMNTSYCPDPHCNESENNNFAKPFNVDGK